MPSVSRVSGNSDVGLIEERFELAAAVKDRHLLVLPRRPNPGGDRKSKRLQHQRRWFRHHAVAEEPDAPFLWPDDPCPQPLSIGLSRLIARHVPMKAQYVHDDVFGHHRIAARRLHFAERHLRQFGMVDKRLDTGRAAEHRFQIGEYRQRVEIGVHEGEILDIRQPSRIGPDTNFQLGELFRKGVAPRFRVADTLVEIDDE